MRRQAWLIFLAVLSAVTICLKMDMRRTEEFGSLSGGPYILSVRDVLQKGERTEIRARGVSVSCFRLEEEIRSGSVVKVYGVPKPVNELKSKDYARYLRSRGVRFTVSAARVEVIGYEPNVFYFIGKIRSTLGRRIETIFRMNSPLVKALIYGERSEIGEEMSDVFSKTGMAHIIAISGFHIGMIAALGMRLGKRFPARFRQAMTLGAVLFFVLLTGARPSAVRAGIFFGIGILAVRLRKEYDLISTALVTASLLMAWNPYVVYDRGFVLSFSGVLSIGLFDPMLTKGFSKLGLPRPIVNLLALTVSVQMLILPLSYYYFGRVSLISIVSNVVFVPLISGVYPLLFLSLICYELPVVGKVFQMLAVSGLEIFEQGNRGLAQLPMSYLDFGDPSLPVTAGIYGMIFVGYILIWKKILKENGNHATGFETAYQSRGREGFSAVRGGSFSDGRGN